MEKEESDAGEQEFEGSDFDEEELAAFGDENFDEQDSDENMQDESMDEGIDEDSSEGNESPKTDEKLSDGKSESNKTVSRIPEFTSNLDTVNEKLPASGRYIPPALRGEQNALERSIRGHLNKLAASNLHSISNEFGAIFRTNARKVVTAAAFKVIQGHIIRPTLTPLAIIEDFSCFLIVIHQIVSPEISSYVLEELGRHFMALYQEKIEDCKMENLLAFICCLTRLQLFKSKMVVQIWNRLISRFSTKDVKLIQTMLNSVAFSVRKEDPAALKEIILATHKKDKEEKVALETDGGSRIKFMLETLTNVKNNNLSAIKNNIGFVDKERDDKCKKRVRAVTGKIALEPVPAIGLTDIEKIEELGRWWQVGAAVVVKRNDETEKNNQDLIKKDMVSEQLRLMAKKLHFNTDNRRNIFYIINQSEDFVDATNKIIGLRLVKTNRQVCTKN